MRATESSWTVSETEETVQSGALHLEVAITGGDEVVLSAAQRQHALVQVARTARDQLRNLRVYGAPLRVSALLEGRARCGGALCTHRRGADERDRGDLGVVDQAVDGILCACGGG